MTFFELPKSLLDLGLGVIELSCNLIDLSFELQDHAILARRNRLAFGLDDELTDFLAGVAMETVALDDGGVDLFTPENAFESVFHRRGAGAG